MTYNHIAGCPKPRSDITFNSPGGKKSFSSLKEQAKFFLDAYWPSWTTSESHILPPVFNFKHPHISDEVIERAIANAASSSSNACESSTICKNKAPTDAIITDRQGDKAEYIVFKALYQLIQDKIQAPFMVIHDLDLKTLHGQIGLENLLGISRCLCQYQKCFRQYDFLLIGPKIGLVVIEVKSGKFDRAGDFIEGSELFPEKYQHGLDQLKSINDLLCMLKICTKVDTEKNKNCVRRILFTPNLNFKAIYYKWVQKIPFEKIEEYGKNVDKIKLWFDKDKSNSDDEAGKLPLYSTLKKLLLEKDHEITDELYKAYATIMAGLASITIPYKYEPNIGMLSPAPDITKYREAMAVVAVCSSLVSQKLMEMNPNLSEINSKALTDELEQILSLHMEEEPENKPENEHVLNFLRKLDVNKNIPKGYQHQEKNFSTALGVSMKIQKKWSKSCMKIKTKSNEQKRCISDEDKKKKREQMNLQQQVFFLSDDQQIALKCQFRRQFIVGAAGTGKTLILKAKAIELLEQNASVMILAPPAYMSWYKRFFDRWSSTTNDKQKIRYQVCNLFHFEILCQDQEVIDLINSLHDWSNQDDQKLANSTWESENDKQKKTTKRALFKANTLADILNFLNKYDHIMIDDAFDKNSTNLFNSATVFLSPLIAMLVAKAYFPEKYVWVAIDLFKYYAPDSSDYKYYQKLSNILLNYSGDSSKISANRDYSVVILKQVMRCSKNIHDIIYPKICWNLKLKPEIAHMIAGAEVKSITVSFPSANKAKRGLWKLVKCEIINLISKENNITLSDIAVIINAPFRGSNYRKEFKKRWQKWTMLNSKDYPHLNFKKLAIKPWNQVSSTEWSFVIYAHSVLKKQAIKQGNDEFSLFRKYRAVSRAMAKLILIEVTYDRKRQKPTRKAKRKAFLGDRGSIEDLTDKELFLDNLFLE